MEKNKITWTTIVFLLVLGLPGLRGQTTLNVNEKSGTQASFVLSNLHKLVFTSGNMTVSQKDGSNTDFALLNIRNLTFTEITSNNEVNPAETDVMLYPNPVQDKLQVRYESATEENVQLQLIDIQSRVLYQQSLKSQPGVNYFDIPMESFQKGLYLCRVQKGDKIEIHKFIKY
ncbi:MAG: T9SS type A sorting domain-containing protein [Bacteroidota bacterium]|nr:T9SS type A sorting domain-containing protein [Bacteroidota bacterium]